MFLGLKMHDANLCFQYAIAAPLCVSIFLCILSISVPESLFFLKVSGHIELNAHLNPI